MCIWVAFVLECTQGTSVHRRERSHGLKMKTNRETERKMKKVKESERSVLCLSVWHIFVDWMQTIDDLGQSYVCAYVFVSYHVSSQVNAEDSDSAKRQRNTSNDEEEKRRDLRDVAGKSVGYWLLQVIKDQTTFRRQKRWHRWLWKFIFFLLEL